MFTTSKLFGTLVAVVTLAASTVATPIEVNNATIRVRAADVTHTGHGTFFDTGLGACGVTSHDSDPVVAIGIGRFGSGGNCFQWMRITNTANGKTVFGQTVDSCDACGVNDVDMSPSLFNQLSPPSDGVITISWNFEPFGFQPPK